jgi:hypothetical protein
MNEFPLYTSLKSSIPKKDLTVKQKDDFITKVESLDDRGKELVYVLISTHHSQLHPKNPEMFPYGGVSFGKSATFDFSLFPSDLRHILCKFAHMHINTMREEKVRAKEILQSSPTANLSTKDKQK